MLSVIMLSVIMLSVVPPQVAVFKATVVIYRCKIFIKLSAQGIECFIHTIINRGKIDIVKLTKKVREKKQRPML